MKSRLLLVMALLAATATGFLFALTLRTPQAAPIPPVTSGQPVRSLAPMLEDVLPAVVNIRTASKVPVHRPILRDPFFRFFFDLERIPRKRIKRSLGSGVIINAEQGYVLTNYHVIKGADTIVVALLDGRSFHAEVIGVDPQTDLALLQIPSRNLTELPLGDSTDLRVGDFVVAVGNPFGLGQSVTSGIVSGLGRHGIGGVAFQNFIQTDAPINPGNSGGALVTLTGELVGINTAIMSTSGGNIGIGFAIPASMAKRVVEQLIKHGEVRRGTLGLDTQTLSPELAKALGLKRSQGAVVTRVQPGSPAAEAGVQIGDVVLAVNDSKIQDAHALRTALGLMPVGQDVTLAVSRDGERLELEAEIALPTRIRIPGAELDQKLTGAVFSELSQKLRHSGLRHGVAVAEIEPGSTAWAYGLRKGDIILAVNRTQVTDLAEFKELLSTDTPRLLLNVLRGRRTFFLLLD